MTIRIAPNREPRHPGRVLLEDYLEELRMTQAELARRIGVTNVRINELVKGKRAMTTDTALRLERLFGTSAQSWLNAQLRYDLWHAMHSPAAKEIRKIRPVAA